MLKLRFKDQRQPAIWLSDERFTIGQDPNNNLALREQEVAPFHAEIRREDNQYYLADTGTNRTFVNGVRISARYQLRTGDNIKIANVELEISSPEIEGAAALNEGWSIQAITGELKGQRFPISGSMTLGRSSSCEIPIQDDRISRRHSELQLKDGGLRIKDLGSANGTLVNRKKIKETALASGDQIQFDTVTFLVVGPTNTEALEPEVDDDVTVFSMAPLKKPAIVDNVAAKTAPKTSPQQSIKMDLGASQQVSMPGSEQNNARSLDRFFSKPVVTTLLIIAVATGAGYWYLSI